MNKNIFLTLLLIALGVVVGLFLADQTQRMSNTPLPVESVSLRLKWLHQAQFTGNYVAKEKGFYAEEGLDVDLQPVDLKENSINALLNNKADFAIAGADEVLIAVSEGKPVKAIAVIYRLSPVVAYSLKSSGITTPKDFVGKTVGLQTGGNIEYLYRVMMSRSGIASKDVKEVAVGHDANELIDGKVDVSTGYIINEPQMAIEAGHEVNTILMADFGASMNADVLVTTDKLIRERPELVRGFVRATLRGWQYAFENESDAVSDVMKYAKDSSRIHQERMLRVSVPLINSSTGRLGEMNASEWSSAQDILFAQKLLSRKIDVADAFTMQFLDSIYK